MPKYYYHCFTLIKTSGLHSSFPPMSLLSRQLEILWVGVFSRTEQYHHPPLTVIIQLLQYSINRHHTDKYKTSSFHLFFLKQSFQYATVNKPRYQVTHSHKIWQTAQCCPAQLLTPFKLPLRWLIWVIGKLCLQQTAQHPPASTPGWPGTAVPYPHQLERPTE